MKIYKRFFKEKTSVSEKEQQAIDAYFGMSFGLINRCLRGTDSSSQAEEYIQSIDSVMKRNTVRSLILYRGIASILPSSQKLIDDLLSSQIGEVFKDKAYMSTSPDIKVAGAWAKQGGVILKLKIKNAHGFYRKEVASLPTNENEILLDRDLKFKIVGRETIHIYNTDMTVISLTQV